MAAVIPRYNLRVIEADAISGCTNFRILETRLTRNTLFLKIEYRSQRDPGVAAIWDKASKQLYLIGGRIDEFPGKNVSSGIRYVLGPRTVAILAILRSSIPEEVTTVYGRCPAIHVDSLSIAPAKYTLVTLRAAS